MSAAADCFNSIGTLVKQTECLLANGTTDIPGALAISSDDPNETFPILLSTRSLVPIQVKAR
jgi:hypothetical protein